MKLFEMFDRVNKTQTNESFLNKRRMFEHENNIKLFDDNLNENDNNKRELALGFLIKNDLETTPEEFYESLMKSKHPDMLTPYSVSELSKMKLFKIPDMDIGYALKEFGNEGYKELVAVHNNEPDVKGIGKDLVQSAVKNGACYLDHFDGFLTSLYQSMGFDEYKREPYNSEYDPDGKFKSKYGESDVIYRKHRSCN